METQTGHFVMHSSSHAAILVISSHVVRGSVGNRAAVFALEHLGHPVWALPTVILPWHPGHGRSTRIPIAGAEFGAAVADLAASSHIGEVAAVLTGYFASADQVVAAANLIAGMKKAKPDLLYLCDPVIGDSGGLYVSLEVAEAIKQYLLPLASIATPNRFELEWFVGLKPESSAGLIEAALLLGPPRILVTSAFAMMAASTGNLWVTSSDVFLAEHRLVKDPPNGLGDLLAALLLSRLMGGQPEQAAVQMATSSVFEVMASSMKRGSDELTLALDASSLATPMAMVQMRTMMHPDRSVTRLGSEA